MSRTPYSDPEAEAEYQKIDQGSSGVSAATPENMKGGSQSSIPFDVMSPQVYTLDQARKKLGR